MAAPARRRPPARWLSARSAAVAMRPSMSTSSAVVKRTALAIVWRWRKVCDRAARQQRLGMPCRHLDEEAEDVVVAHLQRLDAGRLDVAGLERGHHPAAVVREAARLVELGPVAGPHEAAVALQMRRIVDERARRASGERRRRTPRVAGDAAELVGQAHAPAPPSSSAARARRAQAHRVPRRDRAGRRAARRAATRRARYRAPPAARRARSLAQQLVRRSESRPRRAGH